MEHDVNRFAQIAVRVWGCQMDFANPRNTALEGIACLQTFLKSIGMPCNFEELGAKEEDIPKMAQVACFGDTRSGTIGNYVKLKQEDVEKIYRLML